MPTETTSAREATAYCDRITHRQGERVELRASGEGPADLDVVRLHRPPDDPSWSMPCFSPVDAITAQRIRLEPHETHAGSYLTVDGLPVGPTTPVSGSAYVLPTLLASGHVQGVFALSGTGAGVAVVLDPDGGLSLSWDEAELASPVRLVEGRWHVVSWSVDPASGEFSLAHRPVRPAPHGIGRWAGSARAAGTPATGSTRLLVGAARVAAAPDASTLPGTPGRRTSFNGKIDAPVLVAAALPPGELEAATPERLRGRGPVLGAWDFSREQSSDRAVDTGPHGRHGLLVNGPARAMTGVHWKADEQNWTHATEQYSAVHFHDDDLDDARWPVAATVDLPEDLPTGIYAIRLRPSGDDDRQELVTIVVAPRGRPGPEVRTLVVLPTYTYMAYANNLGNGEKLDYAQAGLAEGEVEPHAGQQRLFAFPEIGGSVYDVHSDGSGRCYSSPRRPILNLKPDWKSGRRDAYRHLAADLYIPTWLESLGIPYDVTTDHVVNADGAAALEGYSVVLTGTHPEYISRPIIAALHAHLDTGGCLLYLGGNGFYWVTSESAEVPELVEVRRGFQGTRTWTGAAGESHHSQTGELGGLWRLRGLPPNDIVGVGFAAQGADGGAAGYRRADGALSQDAAFLFDGVESEVFGTTGYDMGGAAGDEVDRYSVPHGSAPWATVAASSLPLSKFYKLTIEDIQMSRENNGGDHMPEVRADLVVTDHAAGGFVFATGSISWVQSMAVGEFDNDVARITGNALRTALARTEK
ncbi:MAG TPA: N,N-dimethylformamidase beta subunit family domain-containing protein [Streptosporangiaceae bacterium]|jgi:N,N-dimethylformamidase